jgi:hypothetical protein
VNVYGCGVVVFIRGKGSNASSISSLKKKSKKNSKVKGNGKGVRVESVRVSSHS